MVMESERGEGLKPPLSRGDASETGGAKQTMAKRLMLTSKRADIICEWRDGKLGLGRDIWRVFYGWRMSVGWQIIVNTQPKLEAPEFLARGCAGRVGRIT